MFITDKGKCGELFILTKRLRDLREDNDFKQEVVAKVLGITRQQYQLYESGKREMPMHHFITLALYYNVSLDYLMATEISQQSTNNKVNETGQITITSSNENVITTCYKVLSSGKMHCI